MKHGIREFLADPEMRILLGIGASVWCAAMSLALMNGASFWTAFSIANIAFAFVNIAYTFATLVRR